MTGPTRHVIEYVGGQLDGTRRVLFGHLPDTLELPTGPTAAWIRAAAERGVDVEHGVIVFVRRAGVDERAEVIPYDLDPSLSRPWRECSP